MQYHTVGEVKFFIEINELCLKQKKFFVLPIVVANHIRKHLIQESSDSELLWVHELLINVRSWKKLLRVLKELHHLYNSEAIKEYLNDAYSVILYIFNKNDQKKLSRDKRKIYDVTKFIRFVSCNLCWRYVAQIGYSKVTSTYCYFHSPTSSQSRYKKAKRVLHEEINAHGVVMKIGENKLGALVKDIRNNFADIFHTSDKLNHAVFQSDQLLLTPNPDLVQENKIKMKDVWSTLVLLKEYIKENKGNISDPLSILYTMSPSEPTEHESIQEKRALLYQAFAKDMALHLGQMCYAEAWLRLLKERSDNHGGRRPGAGYPKGRPRKRMPDMR